MTFLLSRIKIWGLAIAGAALTALVATVKLLSHQNSRLRHRVENAEAKAKRAVIISQKDKEIDEQTHSRRAEITKDLDDSVSDYDPNELFGDKRDT